MNGRIWDTLSGRPVMHVMHAFNSVQIYVFYEQFMVVFIALSWRPTQ